MAARAVVAAVLLAMLAGCAGQETRPAGWKKEGVGAEDARRAESRCRARANYEVDREFGRELDSAPDGRDVFAGYARTTRQYDAKRRIESLVSDCMAREGFAPIR